MKTYWDYTEKERANMSEDDVRQLLDLELMVKGCLKPTAPTLREMLPVEPPDKNGYVIGGAEGLIFPTADDCAKVLALNPKRLIYDWNGNKQSYYADELEPRYNGIEERKYYSRDLLNKIKNNLKHNGEAANYNDSATKEYAKANEASDKICSVVWQDYYEMLSLLRKSKKIMDTLTEYTKMADGNEELAMGFLEKIYTKDEIDKAKEMLA